MNGNNLSPGSSSSNVGGDVLLVKVETDKIPAEVVKTASLETKTTLPTQDLADNLTIAQAIGNKIDTAVTAVGTDTIAIGLEYHIY